MKKIILNICIISGLLISSVYAQEVMGDPAQDSSVRENFNQSSSLLDEVLDKPKEKISEETTSETKEEIPAPQINSSSIIITAEPENETLINSETVGTTTSSTSSEPLINSVQVDKQNSASLFIRNGNDIVYQGEVPVNEEETIKIKDVNDVEHQISSNSGLGILYKADELNDDFKISKVKFYSFGAYLSCIEFKGEELCENWQYRLNGFSPWDSIDTSIVKPGDEIGLYFGNPYQVIFENGNHLINNPVKVYAQQYDYKNNSWIARTGVTLGATVPNPDDIWNPIELMTSSVNAGGEAQFTFATSGEYFIGVKDDFYYPTYPLTISTSTTSTTTDNATSTSTSGGGSGSSSKNFDVEKAISFLKNLQAEDGSYGGSELYSDWVAVAFGSAGKQDSSLLNYLKSNSKIKNLLTDNERRAMALLSLKQNPYDFEGKNYIEAIVKEFDGTQFGETNLVNDDIFALIVLAQTGYKSSDTEITKAIQFIISNQRGDGSWEQSVDLTSSAIQALSQFNSVSGVSSSISKAKIFLKNEQKNDGGWSSSFSTIWAMQAMYELGENWNKEKSPKEYLSNSQQSDGAVLTNSETVQNRIWATSYAIPAALEKPWSEFLSSYSKPKNIEVNNDSSSSNDNSTSTATTTKEVSPEKKETESATTTLDLATTTATSLLSDNSITENQYDNSLEPKIDVSENGTSSNLLTSSTSENQLALVSNSGILRYWWAYALLVIALGLGIIKFIKR